MRAFLTRKLINVVCQASLLQVSLKNNHLVLGKCDGQGDDYAIVSFSNGRLSFLRIDWCAGGGEPFEPQVVPERIEHWVQSEQGRSERHP
jgi:hypothetical protein